MAAPSTELPRDNYLYPPLPAGSYTRLLELAPTKDEAEPLRCHLQVVDIDQLECTYEALSYTWGAPAFTQTILVDGALKCITENLSHALLRFRSRDKVRRIWADAICINQEDPAEKSTQIPLMSSIYRGATRVLVWLGRASGDDNLLERLNLVGTRLWPHKTSRPEDSAHGLSLLVNLLQLSWFSRRWIIQEVVLNPDVVVCQGPFEMSWLRLHTMTQAILTAGHGAVGGQSPKAVTSLTAMMDLWRTWAMGNLKEQGQCEMCDLLDKFDHFGCSDGRDRIFALASLATDVITASGSDRDFPIFTVGRIPVRVDYTLSPMAVYADLAQYIIKDQNQLLWWLGQAGARVKQDAWPSWLPDWRVPRSQRPLWGSSKQCEVKGMRLEGGNGLRIQGIQLHHFYAWITQQDGLIASYPARQQLNQTHQGILHRWGERVVKGTRIVSRIGMTIAWRSRAFPEDAKDASEVSKWVSEVVVGACNSWGDTTPEMWETKVGEVASTLFGDGEFIGNLSEELKDMVNVNVPWDLGNPEPTKYDVIKVFRDRLLGSPPVPGRVQRLTESNINSFLELLEHIMVGRCVFTCSARAKPSFETVGIGSSHLEPGDTVISPCRHPYSGTRPQSIHSCQEFWKLSFVVRETPSVTDVVPEDEHLTRNPPPLRLIGDSFLYKGFQDLKEVPDCEADECSRAIDLVFY